MIAQTLANGAVDCALFELDRPVLDFQDKLPPGFKPTPEIIERYYREVGGWWDRYIDAYGDGDYREVFVADGHRRYMSWCGIFAGWCFQNVGRFLQGDVCLDVAIKPEVAQLCLASTYRLASKSKWRQADVPVPYAPEIDEIRRGDIVVVGDDKSYGDHITLALGKVSNGWLDTISGNSYGRNPAGNSVEGVVKKKYRTSDLVVAYRLDLPHFQGTALGK